MADNKEFLDSTGLTYLWTKLKAKFLSLNGGTLNGQLELKPYDNGSSRLFKNHSATADYGTVLQDTDKNGNSIKIALQASDGSFYFGDKNGGIHKIFGEHNPPTKVGTLTTDVKIKKSGVTYESTFGQGSNNVLMRIHNVSGNENNKRTLALFDSSYREDVRNALRLYDVINGVESIYDIFGEHNPPVKLLWENASKSSDFGAQTVSLNLSDYAMVRVEPQNGPSVDVKIGEAKNVSYDHVYGTNAKNFNTHWRTITAAGTGVTFSEGKLVDGDTGKISTNNAALKPYRIYGIKGVS